MPDPVEVIVVRCENCDDEMLVVKGSWPDQERLCNPCVLGWRPWSAWREQD